MNRITRISFSALALLAAFTLGMIFAQRFLLTPARAEGENPIVSAFPIITEQTTQGDGITKTSVRRVVAIRANGEYSIRTYGRYQADDFEGKF